MKLVCIKKGKIRGLTEGKSYTPLRETSGIHRDSNIEYRNVLIINDSGIERSYSRKRFITLEEFRDRTIQNLFDNSFN